MPSCEVHRSPIRPLEVLTASTGSPTSHPDLRGAASNLEEKIIFFFGMDRSQISLKNIIVDWINDSLIWRPSQTDNVLLHRPTWRNCQNICNNFLQIETSQLDNLCYSHRSSLNESFKDFRYNSTSKMHLILTWLDIKFHLCCGMITRTRNCVWIFPKTLTPNTHEPVPCSRGVADEGRYLSCAQSQSSPRF